MNGTVRPERPPLLWAGLGLLAAAGPGVFGWQMRERQRAKDSVSALEARLSLGSEDGPEVAVAERRSGPRLFYRVTLADPPLGRTLDLSCDWTEPAGRVAHHNTWRTLNIDHAPWRTHCQWVLPVTAPVGSWRVSMRLGDRELRIGTFEVRD